MKDKDKQIKTQSQEPKLMAECPYCKRLLARPMPHNCDTGFRKNFHGLPWKAIAKRPDSQEPILEEETDRVLIRNKAADTLAKKARKAIADLVTAAPDDEEAVKESMEILYKACDSLEAAERKIKQAGTHIKLLNECDDTSTRVIGEMDEEIEQLQAKLEAAEEENKQLKGEKPIPYAWWKDCPKLAQRTMERIIKTNEQLQEQLEAKK